MARIVRFHATGDPDVLQLDELEVVDPGADEIRIKVEALGLNRAELGFRRGMYLEPPKLPARIGYEAAGVIDAVGADVTQFNVGDRVSTIPAFSMNRYGVYGESATVPARAAAPYPDNLSASEGAAIWMQYLTAWGALIMHGQIKQGDSVIITAASSSVGIAAIQICNQAGATAIATTRGADKKDFIASQGADHVIVTDEEDMVARVQEITDGNGASMSFDPVAGPFLEKVVSSLQQGGLAIQYGALYPGPTEFPLRATLGRAITIRGYVLFEFSHDAQTLAPGIKFVNDGLASGALKPILDEQRFSLDNIAGAHAYMETNVQKGKVIVTV